MRMTSFPTVLVAAAAMWLVGCDPEESDMGPGTTINQNPGQAGYDAGTSQDAAAPGVPGGGTTGGTGGGGFDAGLLSDGSVGPGRPDTGVGVGNGQEASVPDAAPSEAGPAGDASVPSEGGTGGYSPCPGGGMPCKILPLGDSITYGIDSSPSPSTGSYRVELFNKAKAAGKPITFLGTLQSGPNNLPDGTPFPKANEGWSGYIIDQISGKATAGLQMKPDIVLLMAGTNDVNLGRDLPNAPKRLGALIDKIIAADAHILVVVAQITPLEASFFNPDPDPAVKALNAGIPAEVSKRANEGKHVIMVDMYTGFPSGGLSEGVHPNKQGYDWMAGVWYTAIASALR